MRATVERELKLDVPESFALPSLPGAELPVRTFTSTYHDTPDRSLARSGITLRRRLENGKSLWQLKLPRSGDGTARAEIEAPGGPAGPPASLKQLLTAHLRHGRLEPVATLRTRRSGVEVQDGERRVAEVTLDEVEVLDAGHSAGGFNELEVELVEGGRATDLERLGRVLRGAGARRSAGAPKLLRVLELPPAPTVRKSAPLLTHLRHFLEEQLAALEAHDPGVRLGTDPEDVHKFRVATRRARALIRATRPLLGDHLAPLADELRWLAALLGPVRDLDVLLEHLREEVAALDVDGQAGTLLLSALETDREARRLELLEALASPRYATVLQTFDAAVAQLPPLDADGSAPAIAHDAVCKLKKAAAELPDDPADEQLHRVRIKAKRARYAAELAALGGDKAAARTVEAFKRVQDLLGEHQDAVVAEARLRGLARANSALAAGRLVERERERKRSMRDAYPAALALALREGGKAFP